MNANLANVAETMDEHEAFCARFEAMRIATGPHLPLSLEGIVADVPAVRICDYCGECPAEGYVPQYKAHVCTACYEDHHGPSY